MYEGRIAVFGGRDITDEVYKNTVELGQRLARENWLVFCGGAEGVMEAIAKGVQAENGTCIGILKSDDPCKGNEYLTIPIATGIGIARNVLLAYNCDVAIAVSGNYGTLSEIAYAFQLHKPVVGYKTWDLDNVIEASTPSDVVDKVKEILTKD